MLEEHPPHSKAENLGFLLANIGMITHHSGSIALIIVTLIVTLNLALFVVSRQVESVIF